MSRGPAQSKVQKSIATANQIVHNLVKNCSTLGGLFVSKGKLFQSFSYCSGKKAVFVWISSHWRSDEMKWTLG